MMKKNTSKHHEKWLFYLIILLLGVPQFTYRFKHKEMTETQLFLNFFTAYKEFFYEQ